MISNFLLAIIVFGGLLAIAAFGYSVSHRAANRNNASRHADDAPPAPMPGGPGPYN
jgi:hypothetical protein